MKTEISLIRTSLRRYTFESKKIMNWVLSNSRGQVLNLFAGKTILGLGEIRVDLDCALNPDFAVDALDFVTTYKGNKFDTIIIDPPYSYRKSMELYKGNYSSRFKRLADVIPSILLKNGVVISFGYHSTFLSRTRGFNLYKLCVFAHGGAQHCTIGIIEKKEYEK